ARSGTKFHAVEKAGYGRRDHVAVTDSCLALFKHGYNERTTRDRSGLHAHRFWPESGHNCNNESGEHSVRDELLQLSRPPPDATGCGGLRSSDGSCFHHSLAFRTPRRSRLWIRRLTTANERPEESKTIRAA